MADKKHQTEQQEELRDLDVPEKDAEDVKGGRRKSGYIIFTQKNGLISNVRAGGEATR